MDEKSIIGFCKENSILRHFFRGVFLFEKSKLSRMIKIGDFEILNIQNSHWIVVIKTGIRNFMFFDSLNGVLLPSKKYIKHMFWRNMHIAPKIIFIFPGRYELQKSDVITCGEHSVYFALYQTSYYIIHGVFDKHYVQNIVKISEYRNESSDQFIWSQIYDKLKLGPKPDLNLVFDWYNKQTKLI